MLDCNSLPSDEFVEAVQLYALQGSLIPRPHPPRGRGLRGEATSKYDAIFSRQQDSLGMLIFFRLPRPAIKLASYPLLHRSYRRLQYE